MWSAPGRVGGGREGGDWVRAAHPGDSSPSYFGVARVESEGWNGGVSLRGVMRRERLSFGALSDIWSCEIDAKSALGRVSVPAGRHAA